MLSYRVTILSAATALALLASPPSRPQENPAGPLLRTTTRIVVVNATVTDERGNPVRGLSSEDFTLLDGGRPQKVSSFALFENGGLAAETKPEDPNTYSNNPVSNAAAANVTILLFDALNSHWTAQGYALHRVRKFLRQIEPQDYVGIYVLGDEMKVIHNFNRNASDLSAAIRRYDDSHSQSHEAHNAAQESTGDPDLDRFLSGRDNRYRFELSKAVTPAYRRDKLTFAKDMTIASLQEISRQLAAVPGRKSLLWVSDKIPTGTGWLTLDDLTELMQDIPDRPGIKFPNVPPPRDRNELERLIRLMNDAGIAVYPVSAEGLVTEDLGFRNTAGGSSQGPVQNPAVPLPDSGGHADMSEIASRTGGRAFFNRNDLETGMRRALDDSRLTYQLGYYPDHSNWKGEWRRIQLMVNRPGVTVLARGGYFALPDPPPVPPKNRFQFLSQIAASPIDSTQLPLTVRIATVSTAGGPGIKASVHLNPQSMLSDLDNGNRRGSFELMFMQIDAKNKLLDASQKEVEASLDPNEFSDISKNGWDLPVQLNFKSGATLLCVILHDKSSDAVGSVRIPLARYSAALNSH